MTAKPTMYARKEPDGFWTLRQERFRRQLARGREHPHDVCAVARSIDELKSMCANWPGADYSAGEN